MNLTTSLTNWIASPIGQAAVPALCLTWWRVGLAEATLTLLLSVAALTFSQLVIASQRRFEAAVMAKLDELLFAFPAARDELLHLEDLPEREIQELRR